MSDKKRFTLLSRELPFRERIFRMIMIVGGIVAGVSIIETILLVGLDTSEIPLFVLLIAISLSLFISVKYNMHKVVAVFFDLLMMIVVFPNMFVSNGGVNGGASIWFVVCIIFTFIMFKGKSLIILLVLNILTEIIVYYFSYNYPSIVVSLRSRRGEYFDSLFSVIVVGMAVGAIIKFQIKGLEEERAVVEKQRKELEELSKSKDLFFAGMSHELRTPINTIIGLNEMIMRKNSDEKIRGYSENVDHASKMLLNLINDILDFSQMEMDSLDIVESKYYTSELFKDVISIIQPRAVEKQLSFECDIDENMPSVLMGDKKRIEQILINLLNNAVKYTREGAVTFSVVTEEIDEEYIQMKMIVEDTGIGIRKEDMEYLYNAFRRVDIQNNKNIQGSGLGLSITKQLVDKMDGTITVDSNYTKGSVFTVVLKQKIHDGKPLGKIEKYIYNKGRLPREYKPKFEAPQARILVVDDNAMNLHVIRELLSSTKVQLDTVLSGEECLQMTLKHFYNVILLDHMMPGIDGIETIQGIKKQNNGLCRNTPVIALTANVGSKYEELYNEMGFSCYLAKPIDSRLMEEYLLTLLPDDIVEYQSYQLFYDQEVPVRKKIKKNKKKVIISTDCLAEVPKEIAEKFDISIMYLYINTPRGRFKDTIEIDTDCLSDYLTDSYSDAYATSVSIAEYEQYFSNLLERAENVIHISCASNMGESYNVAVAASKSFGHVNVIDSKQISCGQRLIIKYAINLVEMGKDVKEICKLIEIMSDKIENRFVLPSADIFYRQGYTSDFFAKFCRMFKLRPILKMKQSKLSVEGFEMGSMGIARKRFVKKYIRPKKNIYNHIVICSHAGVEINELEEINSIIEKNMEAKYIDIEKASFACACNSGMGSFGMAYFKDVTDEEIEVIEYVKG